MNSKYHHYTNKNQNCNNHQLNYSKNSLNYNLLNNILYNRANYMNKKSILLIIKIKSYFKN